MPNVTFPKYDLDSSIDVAATIRQHSESETVSSLELAAFLGYKSTNNGAYLNRVAAARAFGLIEGQASAIKTTRRARDILAPDYPATEARARLEAFTSVPLYARFLQRYEGQPLPDKLGMQNALASMGLSPKTAPRALARLLDSAEQAGLFKTAENRMIRPTVASMPAPATDDGQPEATEDKTPETITPQTFSKLIDGLLDELRDAQGWSEDDLQDWLDFWERAVRRHLRMPLKGGSETPGPGV